MDFSSEIKIRTTRSGGKGGQNVNKVETAVIASLHLGTSQLLSEEQKQLVREKLHNRVNADDELLVRSETFRNQLDNKINAIRKLNELVQRALKKKKMRIPTKPSKASKEKRIDSKKRSGERKAGRKKLRPKDLL